MPKKPVLKTTQRRTKTPDKIADLPAKALKGKDAADVMGGITKCELIDKVAANTKLTK